MATLGLMDVRRATCGIDRVTVLSSGRPKVAAVHPLEHIAMPHRQMKFTAFRAAALSLAVLGGLVECAALWRSRLTSMFMAKLRA